MRKIIIGTVAIATMLVACRKKKNDQKVSYDSLTTTTNYFSTFKDSAGNSTVDLSGQVTRTAMTKEIDEYMQVYMALPLDANKLKNMFTNTDAPFVDTTLDSATDINLLSVTAQSFQPADGDVERNWFYNNFDSIAAAGAHARRTASQGVAGTLGSYLMDANGFEYGQFIEKGIVGAVMLDQIANVNLGAEKMAADNIIKVSGRNYTALEHNWDVAYGYLTANDYYPKQAADGTWMESYLGGYIRQVSGIYGDPTQLYLAFLNGRAAIVNNDMNVRDQQIAIINRTIEKAIATVAVSYLNKSKIGTSEASRFHALSGGAGLIYALRYAHNAKTGRDKSNELLGSLMNKTDGFWSITDADIDMVRDYLSTTYVVARDVIVNY